MIKREQDQSEQDLKGGDREFDQDLGKPLLHRHGIEEAIHQLRGIMGLELSHPDMRDPIGELERCSGKDVLLNVLGDPELLHLKDPGDHDPQYHDHHEDHKGSADPPPLNEIDDSLDPQRQGKRNQSVKSRIDIDIANFLPIGPQKS